MYGGDKIWDLTPDGGGPPVQVIIGNAREAIANHPERYSRNPPDGTPQALVAKEKADRAAALAAIDAEAREKQAQIAQEKQAKLAAIAKEQADAKKAAAEKKAAEDAKAAEESGEVPSRDGEIAAAEAEAAAASELAAHEAEEKKKALLAGAPPSAQPAPEVKS